MKQQSDSDYYAARLKAELAAAASARDEYTRSLHEQMAAEYQRLIDNGGVADAAE